MIRILSIHLARQVIAGSLLVSILLLALSSFLSLVGQLGSLVNGYGFYEAVQYVLLGMPQQMYELFPMSVLLGSLLGLGNLASSNELMVMRASGISALRLGQACLVGGLALAIFCGLLGEFVAPVAEQQAKLLRNEARMNRASALARGGIWARDGETVINVKQMITETHLRGLEIIHLDNAGGIAGTLTASDAHATDNGWMLQNVKQTRFLGERTEVSSYVELPWVNQLDASLLRLFVVDPDVLSIRGLLRYMEFLQGNGLDVRRYQLAFWIKVVTPFSILVMVILALPFVFGPLRSVGAGQRIMAGVMLGVGFYLVNLVLGHSGLVFGLSPLVAAWLPTVSVAAIAGIVLYRMP